MAFTGGHKCSWTLTSANSMKVLKMQFYNHNRKYQGLRQGLNLLCPRSLGLMGEQSGANISWSVASTILCVVI